MGVSKIIFYLSIIVVLCNAEDRIFGNQTIIDDENSTIVSAGGLFELGFFSPGKSDNRYLGIWYKSISTGTVVWVANRETPLTDRGGVLRVDENGRLVLRDGVGGIIWSSNSSRAVKKPVGQLLDTGNLVIGYEDDTEPKTYLWQSFDHPGDHLLPGMKLGWDLRNGLNRYLTSWRSSDDPSPGIYTMRIDLDGFPQPILWNGSAVQLRWGPWDGFKFSGISFSSIPNPTFLSNFIVLQTEIYYQFGVSSKSFTMRGNLNPNGSTNLLFWINETQSWRNLQPTRMDDCDRYAFCGANGICNIANKPSENGVCGCLEGFEPKFPERWKTGDWSGGCVRRTALDCRHGDRFIPYMGQKLPDTRRAWFNHSMNLEDCKIRCLNNCSCTAYSNIDIRGGGAGCMIWLNELLDIRDYREDGPNLYVRIAASESAAENRGSRRKKKLGIILIVVSLVLIVLVSSILTAYVLKKRKLRRKGFKLNTSSNPKNNNQDEDLDLPLYEFPVIAIATSHFSEKCKLGEGGFGSVYKGITKDGQEIAVKRLAKNSRQGLDEFKNEISCIAKLQHRNLVRLLGYCFEKDEMLLIYEYMPNYSLDYLLFDKKRREPLDWPNRYNIIIGIARGLLYLHQDSRLRVVHRDLKASNILLDVEMNPRISDFGLARIFWGSESEANTTKVVGTYGYMSPEYALDGIFSTKSDVYSFGVLVLEIVSGMKMRGFYHLDPSLNLLSHAWRLYQEEKCSALLDEAAIDSCNKSELFRAIQVGLLCVQPYPEDRPSMSTVVLMLSSDNELPQPKQPTFFTERNQSLSEFSNIAEISTSASSVF
ncbi:Receptor-like serine/threonine-protein kinase [Heracleum sosnowskyi]|uniref:Receptor-like serine/threonine-protein kinase n=1 Tax=Heracleum sosnowskyi TaxID=360622 RepID=A0AAD8IDI4_9APIA|nr:Receptor-like serine/threonine-protein kinase [Heracleum sosnowskyi]